MFGNGNNQAMQFMMQGYSDSIKTHNDQSAGNLMKNINGLTNSYFQNESSIQNTEAQRLSNHFNRENMTTALKQQEEKLREQKLANEFNEKTFDDRASIVNSNARIGKTEATFGERTLDKAADAKNALSQTTIDTAKSETNKINAENYYKTADANFNKDQTTIWHNTIQYQEEPLKDSNGNYYFMVDGKAKYISQARAQEIFDFNKQVEINRRNLAHTYTEDNIDKLTSSQANAAQNKVAATAADIQAQMQAETIEKLRNSGADLSYLEDATRRAFEDGSKYVILPNGQPMPITQAMAVIGNGAVYQPIGYSQQNVNLSGELGLGIKSTDKQLQAQRFNQMNNPENDPDKKLYIDYYHGGDTSKRKIADSNINLVVKNDNLLQDINSIMNDSNRVQLWLGGLQQFAPSIFGSKASASTALVNYVESDQIITGMKDITGAASDRDAKKLQEKTTDLFKKNDAYNNQITYALNRQKLQKYEEIMRGLGDTKLTGKSLEAIYGKQFMDDYIATRAIVEIGSEYFPNLSRLK